ncbi:MAG TPA: cell division protein ZapE [Rhizomicrobium sp.]
MNVYSRYCQAVAKGELKADAAQMEAARRLQSLGKSLSRHRWFFMKPARGLYIWGDVGRGKSMLMDLFFESAPVAARRRVHFNAFMAEVHERIHALRPSAGPADPILLVAQAIARQTRLLCFDEFQVGDVADAMILGRLFEQFFARGVTIVATSNTPPDRLYEGGLNRQLFLPFIAIIQKRLRVIALNGPLDYRLARLAGQPVYLAPLGSASDAAMDAAWRRLTDTDKGAAMTLTVLGRILPVPQAAKGVARFSFDELCAAPLAAADYLALARHFHTIMIDHVPVIQDRDQARRFVLLVDTLYDEGVKLVCSAAAPPSALYADGDGAEAFRRAASRLAEMQSEDYLKRGHGIHA